MMEGWRGVEEGGESLKGACERLLEERVRRLRVLNRKALTTFLGQSRRANGGYRRPLGILPRARTCHADVELSWRVAHLPVRFFIHG
jgi:hypothetical protein